MASVDTQNNTIGFQNTFGKTNAVSSTDNGSKDLERKEHTVAKAVEMVFDNYATEMDRQDPLKGLRDLFYIPKKENGQSKIYFAGNSLGLKPKRTDEILQEESQAWGDMGVEGHTKNTNPWYSYHTLVRDPLARIVGAQPTEVVAMGSLTGNLHLMMVSFYRPTETRYKILVEAPVFSSDTYAVASQVKFHGHNPEDAIIVVSPREGEDYLRTEDIDAALEAHGSEISLVLFSGVNYFNGQLMDMQHITSKGHEKGALVGFDLAHAAGNVPLHLHDWGVDFAVWCNYKYLNSSPGSIAGAFIHQKHHNNSELPRFAGWWGNDPATRFDLHLQPKFIPVASADGWQLSNPPIFALAPLRASLEIFDKTNMEALRAKSIQLTGYLESLLDSISSDRIKVITPRDPNKRGAHLSIQVNDRPDELLKKLNEAGVSCDFRKPNVIRVAPTPLYNTFQEVKEFVQILKDHLKD